MQLKFPLLIKGCVVAGILGGAIALIGVIGMQRNDVNFSVAGWQEVYRVSHAYAQVYAVGAAIAGVGGGGIVLLGFTMLAQRITLPALKRRSAGAQIKQLQELVATGVLTQAEYDAKARELKKAFI